MRVATRTQSGAAAECRSRSFPTRSPRSAAAGPGERGSAAAAPRKRRRWLSGSTRSRRWSSSPSLWLVITAPLSRALEPLDDPALLMLSDDGHADRPARRDQGSAGRRRQARPAYAGRLRRDRGSPLLPSLGHRSARDRPGLRRQHARRRGAAGWKHDYPAARQDQLPVGRPDDQTQGAGSDHRLLAGSLADQAGDPLALSVERLFRRRRLWAARRRSPLFQPRARSI